MDELCATVPSQPIPLVILPLWGIEACIADRLRTAVPRRSPSGKTRRHLGGAPFHWHVNQCMRPSKLFRWHFHGSFIDDRFGVMNRDHVGIDRVTWEYDHAPSTAEELAACGREVGLPTRARTVE